MQPNKIAVPSNDNLLRPQVLREVRLGDDAIGDVGLDAVPELDGIGDGDREVRVGGRGSGALRRPRGTPLLFHPHSIGVEFLPGLPDWTSLERDSERPGEEEEGVAMEEATAERDCLQESKGADSERD